MNLETISSGRVITHLGSLLAKIESAHSTSSSEILHACKRANDDPIFQAIAQGKFPQPASMGRPLQCLLEQVLELRSLPVTKYRALQPFLESIEHFTRSQQSKWDENSYFIVPVISQANGIAQPGLVYLHTASPEESSAGGSLNVDDLTNDAQFLSATRDYFGTLVSVLLDTLFLVQTCPPDVYSLTPHSYRLHFGCKVTDANSMGAAALALFAVNYLRDRLGAEFHKTVAPQCGTILAGIVDRSGRVLPVEDLAEKVEFAIEEFGGGLKVILPRDEELPERIERRIDAGNLRYVSSAEELLVEVLSAKDGPEGLEQARAALFKRLTPSEKGKLKQYVIDGIDPQVFEKIAQGGKKWTTPKRHAGGVYVVTTAGRDRVDVKLSLELSGLVEDNGRSSLELVELVLDGSDSMDDHWLPNQATKICRMTAVLYEIKNRIDPKKQQLVCGFLSHPKFYPIKPLANAEELENNLQEIRRAHKLSHRGSFFRPVYESSLRAYQNQLKRVFVVADSAPPDLRDLLDLNLSSMTRLSLFGNDSTELEESDPSVVLFPDRQNLDRTELTRHFQQESGSIRSIRMMFNNELPIDWKPHTGVLAQVGDEFELRFDKLDHLKYLVQVQLANQYPNEIKISVRVNNSNGTDTLSVIDHPTLTTLEPLNSMATGQLTNAEFAMWRKFETPEWICPECDTNEAHLLHLPEARAEELPVFASLRHLRGGYLLLCRNSPDWHFFQVGCRISGTSFVVIDDRLHWSQVRGKVEEVRYEGNFYCLRDDSQTFYICRIV